MEIAQPPTVWWGAEALYDSRQHEHQRHVRHVSADPASRGGLYVCGPPVGAREQYDTKCCLCESQKNRLCIAFEYKYSLKIGDSASSQDGWVGQWKMIEKPIIAFICCLNDCEMTLRWGTWGG